MIRRKKHKGIARSITITHNMCRRVLHILAFSIVALCFLYVYFVGSTTMSIADRKAIQEDIRVAHSDMAELEVHYLTLIDDINLARAQEYGFREAQNIHFAYVDASGQNFAFQTE